MSEEQTLPVPQEPATPPASEPPPPAPERSNPPPEKKPTPGEHTFQPQKEQRENRAENRDFVEVLQLFGGHNVPQSYAEHIAAARDVIFNLGQSATTIFTPPLRDSAEVPASEIRLIRQVYQRPGCFQAALTALKSDHCVVLRGQPRVGKRALAIRLALDLGSTALPIRELSPEDDLIEQLRPGLLRPSTIYLVDGLLNVPGRALKAQAVAGVVEKLKAGRCYLLVCVTPEVPLPPRLTEVKVEPPAVSPQLLVEAHLDFYGPFDSDRVQQMLADPAVAAVLERGLLPAQAAQLALQLAAALREEAPPETALHGFATVLAAEVEQWFDATAADLDESAFRIAVAAFNGARYVLVNEAAAALARALRPLPPEKPAEKTMASAVTPPASLFSRKVKDGLGAARAKLVNRTVETEYSARGQVEVVEFEEAGYSTAVLRYVWEQYVVLREPLLDWLMAYAASGSSDMRLRAAGAVGALAGLSGGAFEYLRARVFLLWARAGRDDPAVRRRHHQALGNALGILIWNRERADDVIGLLRDWSAQYTEPALQWAAARAYAQVGLCYPREAVHQWRRILEASKDRFVLRLTENFGISLPDLPLQMSVFDAIITLFLRAVELPHRLRPVYEQALEALSFWVESEAQSKATRPIGLPLFLALTPIRLPPENGGGEPEEWPPAMLYIIGTQPDSSYRQALARMLRHALQHPNWSGMALEALRFWTARADQDKWLEDTLSALLREWSALPGLTPRERERVGAHLDRWRRHPKPRQRLAVAERLLQAIRSPQQENSHAA